MTKPTSVCGCTNHDNLTLLEVKTVKIPLKLFAEFTFKRNTLISIHDKLNSKEMTITKWVSKSRDISYKYTFNSILGKIETRVFETQSFIQRKNCIVVTGIAQSPGVPYGKTFNIVNKMCMVAQGSSTKVFIHVGLDFQRGAPLWKDLIVSAALNGVRKFIAEYVTIIELQEIVFNHKPYILSSTENSSIKLDKSSKVSSKGNSVRESINLETSPTLIPTKPESVTELQTPNLIATPLKNSTSSLEDEYFEAIEHTPLSPLENSSSIQTDWEAFTSDRIYKVPSTLKLPGSWIDHERKSYMNHQGRQIMVQVLYKGKFGDVTLFKDVFGVVCRIVGISPFMLLTWLLCFGRVCFGIGKMMA